MNDLISVQLAISKLHMQTLLEQPLSDNVAMQALAELNTALAELEATNEELNKQNTALAVVTRSNELQALRYRELFERVPVAYIVTDQWGIIEEVNRAAEELLNVSRQLLQAKPISVFVTPAERREFRNRISSVSTEATWEVSFQPRGHDRITVQIDVAALPESVAGQARLGWVLQNLTPARAAASAERLLARETALRVEAQAAVTRLRALNVGLQTMAHDVELPVRQRVANLLDALVPRFAQHFTCYLPTEMDAPIEVGDVVANGNVLQTVLLAPNREPGRLIAKRAVPFTPEDGALLQAAANAISLLLYTA